MFIAIDSKGNRTNIKNVDFRKRYYCPLCRQRLIIKNGKTNTAHFAHITKFNCDGFSVSASEWRSRWLKEFPSRNQEIVIEHNNKKYLADVCVNKHIIEFREDGVSKEEFDIKNKFYTAAGYKVIWIFNFIDLYKKGRIERYDEHYCNNSRVSGGKYKWKQPRKFMQNYNPSYRYDKDIFVFLQFLERWQKGDSVNSRGYSNNGYFERIIWAIYDKEEKKYNYKRFLTSYTPRNIWELKKKIGVK